MKIYKKNGMAETLRAARLPFLLCLALSLAWAVCPGLRAADAPSPATGAAAAYAKGEYGEALRLYGAAAACRAPRNRADAALSDLYYNMGNCAFRLKEYPRAVLCYTRALRHNPGNGDAEFNLSLAESKLALPSEERREMFFVSWARGAVAARTATWWGRAAWGGLAVLALASLLFYLARRVWLRKCGVALAAGGVLWALLCLFSAAQRQSAFEGESRAVVMRPVPCFATPTPTAAKARDLKEGTVVELTGNGNAQWAEAALPDGTLAWLRKSPGAYSLVKD